MDFKGVNHLSEQAIDKIYKRGPALVLEEKQSCLAKYLYADDIKTMFSESIQTLDFVFITACHSEFAAKIFLEAGAHHVIGVVK